MSSRKNLMYDCEVCFESYIPYPEDSDATTTLTTDFPTSSKSAASPGSTIDVTSYTEIESVPGIPPPGSLTTVATVSAAPRETGNPDPKDNQLDTSDGGPSKAAKAGIAIGIVLGIIIFTVASFLLFRRRRAKSHALSKDDENNLQFLTEVVDSDSENAQTQTETGRSGMASILSIDRLLSIYPLSGQGSFQNSRADNIDAETAMGMVVPAVAREADNSSLSSSVKAIKNGSTQMQEGSDRAAVPSAGSESSEVQKLLKEKEMIQRWKHHLTEILEVERREREIQERLDALGHKR